MSAKPKTNGNGQPANHSRPPVSTWFTVDIAARVIEIAESPPYRKTADNNGHSSRVQFRCEPAINQRLTEIRQAPGSGYATDSDVARDMCFRGMSVHELGHPTPHAFRALYELELEEQRKTSLAIQIIGLRKQVDKYRELHLDAKADEIAIQLEAIMCGCSDGDREYIEAAAAHPDVIEKYEQISAQARARGRKEYG